MRRLSVIRMAASLGALVLVAGAQASGAPSSSISIPPGSRVTVTGSTVLLTRANGTSGSYNCYCDSPRGGACSTSQSAGVLQCAGSGSNPCSDCKMDTTTNPKGSAARGAAARMSTRPSVKAP